MLTTHETFDGVRGAVITPDSPDYPEAARTPLGDSRPAVVLRPRDVDDVRRAVRAAAADGRPVAVRGGGHSFARLGTVDDGLVIDLAALDGVRLVGSDRVVVGGGATWGAVAQALAPHGLAISSGDTASVGVGGLLLSGGIGWMVRAHGLALDRLLSAQVVTAAGDLVTTSAEEHPDLFWALRGGGGGTAVVTEVELAAAPVTTLTFGTLTFPAAEAAEVLAGWATHMRHAPRALSSTARLANPFAGGVDAPVEITVAALGAEGATAVEPLRRLGTLLSDGVAERPYVDILEPGAALPPGLRLTVRSGFVAPHRADDAVAEVAALAASPQPAAIVLHALGGAVADVPADATAYSHRDAELMVTTFAGGPTAAVDGVLAGVDGVWSRLAPHVQGSYRNFLDDTSPEAMAATHSAATLRRLAEIRASYDPDGVLGRVGRAR